MADRSAVVRRIEIDEASGCWLWQGAIKSNGYGHLRIDGRTVGAHRVAYELHVGPVPEGMRVLHSCDVRRCVNPDHLHIGTAADNSREMVERGRYRGPSRLDSDARSEIRHRADAGESHRAIAASYGVSPSTISNVVRGRTR
jgi:hypothetical protein